MNRIHKICAKNEPKHNHNMMKTKTGESNDNRTKTKKYNSNRIILVKNALQLIISFVIRFEHFFPLFIVIVWLKFEHFFVGMFNNEHVSHSYRTHLDYIIIRWNINANSLKWLDVATAEALDKAKMWQWKCSTTTSSNASTEKNSIRKIQRRLKKNKRWNNARSIFRAKCMQR